MVTAVRSRILSQSHNRGGDFRGAPHFKLSLGHP